MSEGISQQDMFQGKSSPQDMLNYDTWSRSFISLDDGVNLCYFQNGFGNDKAILFLNGVLGSGEIDAYPYLDGMASDFNCISVDFRGYGCSADEKRTFSVRSFHQDANDAAEVMRKLGYKKYSIYGLSDGGIVAIILAAEHSACVETLILEGAQCYFTEEDVEMIGVLRDLRRWHPIMMLSRRKYYERELMEKLWGEYYEFILSEVQTNSGDMCIAEARRVTLPTLIIQSEDDAVHGMGHAQFLVDNIPKSKLYIHPGSMFTDSGNHEGKVVMVMDFVKKNGG